MLTWFFKMGHGLNLLGLDRVGPIESFVPPIAFAILFGLSMDYEVFLMSRIREEHVHGKDTKTAVRDGVAAIGRVVFAAAIIMSAVFMAFMLTPDRVSKEFGLLLAVAILTDALLMRLTLVPALLSQLGEKSWYMPRWLDKILPNITIEPPTERRDAGQAGARAGDAGRGNLSPHGAARSGARPRARLVLVLQDAPEPGAEERGEPHDHGWRRPRPARCRRGGRAARRCRLAAGQEVGREVSLIWLAMRPVRMPAPSEKPSETPMAAPLERRNEPTATLTRPNTTRVDEVGPDAAQIVAQRGVVERAVAEDVGGDDHQDDRRQAGDDDRDRRPEHARAGTAGGAARRS